MSKSKTGVNSPFDVHKASEQNGRSSSHDLCPSGVARTTITGWWSLSERFELTSAQSQASQARRDSNSAADCGRTRPSERGAETNMRFVMFTELETQHGSTHHRRYMDAIEEAVFAEEMGFDVWGTSEHHFIPDIAPIPSPETLYSAVAMRTSRIRLRHMSRLAAVVHPLLLAEQLASVDILSNGRVELGTARGNTLVQLDAFGISLDDTRGRSEEAIDLIVRAISDDTFEHDGPWWGKIPKRTLTPKSVQRPHPPLYKVCQSVDSAAKAARSGYGMLTTDLYLGWETLASLLDAYNSVPDDEVVPVGRYAVRSAGHIAEAAYCAASNDEAMERAEQNLLRFANVIIKDVYVQLAERSSEYGDFNRYAELRDNVDNADFLRETSPSILVGDPAHCIERIERVKAMGADEFMMRIDGDSHDELMRNIEWFGRYVIPHFKSPDSIVSHGSVGMLPGDEDQIPTYVKYAKK